MPSPKVTTVAIVGAGIAGAAAAIRLAERGVAATLYEAVPEPKPIGAGLLLQPTGQRVLAVRDRFFGWGGKLPYIHQQSIATLAGYKTGWLWGRLKL